jgi:hypothetical protein
MNVNTQKPNAADADSSGMVLAWNQMKKVWVTAPWPHVNLPRFSDWEKLPDAPPVTEKPKPVGNVPTLARKLELKAAADAAKAAKLAEVKETPETPVVAPETPPVAPA